MKKKLTETENEMPANGAPKPILGKKAEEYLRESGSIEDLPNAGEIEEAEIVEKKIKPEGKND